MYHPFCLAIYLKFFKRSNCVSPSYNLPFEEGMIELFDYHQNTIELQKAKLEKGEFRQRSLTPNSSSLKPCKLLLFEAIIFFGVMILFFNFFLFFFVHFFLLQRRNYNCQSCIGHQ
jgi:hypothetical protein